MDHQQILTDTRITEDGPGTILRDFDALLDFVGVDGVETSGKYQLLPMKQLATLNERLCQPIALDLKRPVQKSYPPIQGLYLLLRVSGLALPGKKGRKTVLRIDPEVLASWQGLNPTERYFALLETWLFDMESSLVDERAGSFQDASLDHWLHLREALGKGVANLDKNPELRDRLPYYPGLHNLALMRLFGLLSLQEARPGPGEGWHIKSIHPTPFGDALLARLQQEDLSRAIRGLSADNDETDDPMWFQSHFQRYFPELRHTLELPAQEFREGDHTLKVILPNYCQARLRAPGRATLMALSSAILELVEFDDDHLHCFRYRDRLGEQLDVNHPYVDEGPYTDQTRLGDLDLREGQTLRYIFDFGDHWEFEITVEGIDETASSGTNSVEVLEFRGEKPTQYWGGEDEE